MFVLVVSALLCVLCVGIFCCEVGWDFAVFLLASSMLRMAVCFGGYDVWFKYNVWHNFSFGPQDCFEGAPENCYCPQIVLLNGAFGVSFFQLSVWKSSYIWISHIYKHVN